MELTKFRVRAMKFIAVNVIECTLDPVKSVQVSDFTQSKKRNDGQCNRPWIVQPAIRGVALTDCNHQNMIENLAQTNQLLSQRIASIEGERTEQKTMKPIEVVTVARK